MTARGRAMLAPTTFIDGRSIGRPLPKSANLRFEVDYFYGFDIIKEKN